MNQLFWSRPPLSPELNYDLANLLSFMYDPDPTFPFRAALTPAQKSGLTLRYVLPTSVIPPVMFCSNTWGLTIMVGGTSGQMHVNELFQGWNNPNHGPDAQYGASGGFAHAARDIIALNEPDFIMSQPNIYLVGHSYGGACCQALAMLLFQSRSSLRGVWSYGSPRPGTSVMQRIMSSIPNYRWYNDDDPVRWIPPHSDEASILDTFSTASLVAGCNQQVQTATGFKLDRLGDSVADPGDPTVLHQVALSVLNWVTDTHGFRSVNHGAAEYRRRFQLSLPIKPNGPAIPRAQVEEVPGTIRPREIAAQQEEAMPVIEAQLRVSDSPLNQEIRSVPRKVDSTRYKRRKLGGIWVVVHGAEVVDVGPKKRRAGQLARRYNRLEAANQALLVR
jgi:hypothetical protein